MNEDERYWRWREQRDELEDYVFGAPRRTPKGCWCDLDGYPGACPGAENCPYSGYHDKEDDDDD